MKYIIGMSISLVFSMGAVEENFDPPSVLAVAAAQRAYSEHGVVFNPGYKGPSRSTHAFKVKKKENFSEGLTEKCMRNCGLPCIFWCFGAILCCRDICCCKKS